MCQELCKHEAAMCSKLTERLCFSKSIITAINCTVYMFTKLVHGAIMQLLMSAVGMPFTLTLCVCPVLACQAKALLTDGPFCYIDPVLQRYLCMELHWGG